MDKRTVDALARRLRERRQELVKEVRRAQNDIDTFGEERQNELEEEAQEEERILVLAGLDERGRREIEAIDRALNRIADGRYGICVVCGDAIARERLEALPTAETCVDDAEKLDAERRSQP
jgi:RNA polymerase-binding protein DksA